MNVIINGESHAVSDGLTISTLIDELGLSKRRVAVEVNKNLIRQAQHAEHVLHEDDIIEIVTLVGGG